MRLVLSVALSILWVGGAAVASEAPACGDVGTWSTTCENNGSQIDVSASMNIERSGRDNTNNSGSTPRGDAVENNGSGSSNSNPDADATEPIDAAFLDEDCGLCRGNYTAELLTDEDFPTVTIDDLTSFVPASPSLTGEPSGFGVVAMPTNLVAAASAQEISGELFEIDVVVRFTPATFTFTHGDGTSSTSTTGGASWGALNQAQFTPTATSHVYGERGTYPVSVSVQFTAAVNFGIGWQLVPGYVTATTGGYDVQVLEARTALVDKTCLENPSGPGC